MEPTLSSETLAIRTQTPRNYPKRNKLHLEYGESLKTRMLIVVPLQDTTGLDFDNDLVGFLNSSKFDVNRIMLMKIDGTTGNVCYKKRTLF